MSQNRVLLPSSRSFVTLLPHIWYSSILRVYKYMNLYVISVFMEKTEICLQSLPIAFVRRYLHKIPKNTILKTATGEHSWRLKIKQIGEDYCFAHGWEKLAQDVQLATRDILVFWLVDSFTFQVSFFDEHGCEKDLPLTHTSLVSLSSFI